MNILTMKHNLIKNTIWILSIFLFLGYGCSGDNETLIPTPSPNTGIIYTDLIKLEDAISHADTDFANLVDKVRGSVATIGGATKVIWSKKNDYGLGITISANHVHGVMNWSTRNEVFIDISTVNNGIFISSKIPPTNGDVEFDNLLVASFALYHPKISEAALNTTIWPEEDFFIGILDNQKIVDNGFGVYPEHVKTNNALEMYDIYDRTIADKTWAEVQSDNLALFIGYPHDRTNYPNGAVSTGRIFSDAEAENVIAQLKVLGDEEGNIPYNPQVELLAEARSVVGMSGGGVFNKNGQLIGLMVRGTELNGKPISRAVRISYIKDKLSSFYTSLSAEDKNKLYPFISGEL